MNIITSAANPKFKYFKGLSAKKGRVLGGEYIVEGSKCVSDALNSDRTVTAVIICEELAGKLSLKNGIPLYIMPRHLTDRLSDTKSPQGVFAVIKSESSREFVPEKGGAYVYCDGISDPGNLGTIIRTADSAGFDGVLLSPGCTDPHSPKTVRSCMGSFFHMDVFENISVSDLEAFKKRGGRIFAGLLSDETVDYRSPDYGGSIIIAVGNEANGISDSLKKICTPIKIPIYGRAESLNAAVAASLMIYEAANKRRPDFTDFL
ncbi:MAG: RNA methyltransferase [Clostridia bacterium]|nr:RNA methyltransferase [Clostridia bacterium]